MKLWTFASDDDWPVARLLSGGHVGLRNHAALPVCRFVGETWIRMARAAPTFVSILDCAWRIHISNWLGQDMRPANRMARMHADTAKRLGIDQAPGVGSCLLAMVCQATKDMPRNIPASPGYRTIDIELN